LAVLTGAFIVSRVAFWMAGVRFDMSPLTSGSQQLLPERLLEHQLFTSVWYLHSQPPLFNLYCGLLLHLPPALREPAAWGSFMAIGLVLVLATYLLLIEVRVSRPLALIVGLALVVSPSGVLYENWLFYAYPSAAVLAVAGLMCARYLRTGRWWYGLGFFSCVSGLALMNSTYQAVWVVAVLTLMAIVFRDRLRQLLIVAAIPVLFTVGWMVKDAVMFGTATTSSWVGMNLSDMTLGPAARSGQLHELVRRHQVSELALVGPWQWTWAYTPKFVPPAHTGVAALDDRFGNSTRGPNYNNIVYVGVSSQLLADDLRYIRLEPLAYLRNVGIGAGAWLTPTDQYPFLYRNWSKIHPLVVAYDTGFGWQVRQTPWAGVALNAVAGRAPPAAQLSYTTVLTYVVALLGTPLFLLVRRRRLDRTQVGLLLFLWGTVTYAYLTTSFIDLGENNRFRFELGPLPLVLAIAVCLWSIESLLSERHLQARWWRWFGVSGRRNDG
jgi:hypothetical protein